MRFHEWLATDVHRSSSSPILVLVVIVLATSFSSSLSPMAGETRQLQALAPITDILMR